MPSRRTNDFSESGRGLGVTPTIFGSTVGYPSDSLASCRYPHHIRIRMCIVVEKDYVTVCGFPLIPGSWERTIMWVSDGGGRAGYSDKR